MKKRFGNEKNRKRIGVPRRLWMKMGPDGQVMCQRMWDRLRMCGVSILMPDGSPKLKGSIEKVLRYNIAVEAGLARREMKQDEDGGIAKWM